jgi:hypothetical protein
LRDGVSAQARQSSLGAGAAQRSQRFFHPALVDAAQHGDWPPAGGQDQITLWRSLSQIWLGRVRQSRTVMNSIASSRATMGLQSMYLIKYPFVNTRSGGKPLVAR